MALSQNTHKASNINFLDSLEQRFASPCSKDGGLSASSLDPVFFPKSSSEPRVWFRERGLSPCGLKEPVPLLVVPSYPQNQPDHRRTVHLRGAPVDLFKALRGLAIFQR